MNNRKFKKKSVKIRREMLMYLYLMTKLFFSCIVYAKSTFVETAKKYIHSEKPALQKKTNSAKFRPLNAVIS